MDSVGDTLRRERLRQNLDLQEVARETKIGVRMLEAIEADDFSKLPGGVFAKSFVRQYARILGLDEDELATGVQRMIEPQVPEPGPASAPSVVPRDIAVPRVSSWEGSPRPRRSSALPALALVVVVMLVCSAVYAWWQKSKQPLPEAPLITATPSQQAPAPPVAEPAPPQSATQQPRTEPPAASPAAPAESQPAGAQGVPSENAATGNVHLVLTAEEDTWVQARTNGKVVYSGTLKPNEKADFTGNDEVRLVLGNAGGVNIQLNGKPIPQVGPKGQVRVVEFSPAGVQIVPRKPAAVVPDAL